MNYLEICISAISGILGVILGAYISGRAAALQQNRQVSLEAYSSVISAFLLWSTKRNAENYAALFAACERGRVFFHPEASYLYDAIQAEVLSETPNLDVCARIIKKLSEYAQTDFKTSFEKRRNRIPQHDRAHNQNRNTNKKPKG